ncbi:restriction endonuclease subunit S [Synechocystis sp. FACHB-383]|uniref:restriction endonuclease subunit S n=1 Tax=Synechocystis sp. FACHB-383 TaxID=2692864 RepID=UPI001689308F|nr:restriction endonuclease subunit S [Synechocystis sp. FACHB-383]MBD2651895.1 restriction endonuclease subunit S [Synechocystis sp. FACHB-383]
MAQCDKLEQLQKEKEQKRILIHTSAREKLLKASDQETFGQAWDFIKENFGELYAVKENVTSLRQAILQLAVMGKLVPQDPNDPPASELLKEIETEKQRLIKNHGLKTKAEIYIAQHEEYIDKPKGWSFYRLGNLTKFIDYRGKTPKKIKSGIPLITAKNVRFGFIDREPYEYVSEEEYHSWMTRGFPRLGDLLFTTEAPLGNIAVVDINERFALAQRVICFQLHKSDMNLYLRLLIMSDIFQEQLINSATGMTAKGIKASKLKEIPIPLPPLPEQHRIVAKVEALMALFDRLEKQIEQQTAKQTQLLESMMAEF